MDAVRDFFNAEDKFARHIGAEILEVYPGRARARMEIQPHHRNGLGSVQGGAIFTLADFAFAAACNSHGTVAVALNVNIAFVKAVTEGVLIAEAEEIARGGKTGHYNVRVTDGHNQLVASFQGLAYRKKDILNIGANQKPAQGA